MENQAKAVNNESDIDRIINSVLHSNENQYSIESRLYHILAKLRGSEPEPDMKIKVGEGAKQDVNDLPQIQRIEQFLDDLRVSQAKVSGFLDRLEGIV